MTRNLRIALGVAASFIALVVALIVINQGDSPSATPGGNGTVDTGPVRTDSNRIATNADGKVTVVEFLDFECPSCGAAYPAVKQLLSTYQGKITFVVRYFPIPSHPNGELSARAAQAAANQGKFAEMYAKLFENQAQWSNKQAAQTDVFVGYARDIGLDVDRFTKDLNASATSSFVATDKADGVKAGVTGTPTFFVNGKKVATFTDMTKAIDSALAS